MTQVKDFPKTININDLYSRAYMGDTIFVDGKKKSWLQLKNAKTFQWFTVENVTTNGVTNTFFVTKKAYWSTK